MDTFYYIKFRDKSTQEELFKIGVCTTSVAERWGRENGSQFDDSNYSLELGSKTKMYNTPMEVLLIDSWAFPLPPPGELSRAYQLEQWIKEKFKPYQATNDNRWSYLKEVVRTGMSELFSKDLYECDDLVPSGDVRTYFMQCASALGGELSSESEARKLVAYIGSERLIRKIE